MVNVEYFCCIYLSETYCKQCLLIVKEGLGSLAVFRALIITNWITESTWQTGFFSSFRQRADVKRCLAEIGSAVVTCSPEQPIRPTHPSGAPGQRRVLWCESICVLVFAFKL